MTESRGEQMSIFDLGLCSGRTSREPCQAEPQKERTSESSSKKQPKSQMKLPLYLDLRKENGRIADASWEMGGALLGQYGMHSFTESHNGVGESRLSAILQANVPERYYLSQKACLGILKRALRRGKQLPRILEMALRRQAGLKDDEEIPSDPVQLGRTTDESDSDEE